MYSVMYVATDLPVRSRQEYISSNMWCMAATDISHSFIFVKKVKNCTKPFAITIDMFYLSLLSIYPFLTPSSVSICPFLTPSSVSICPFLTPYYFLNIDHEAQLDVRFATFYTLNKECFNCDKNESAKILYLF